MSMEGVGPGPIEKIMHELRTPLSVISGNVHIVYSHWDRLDRPKRDDLLRTTLEEATALNEMLRNLEGVDSLRPARGKLATVSAEESPVHVVEVEIDFRGKVRKGQSFNAAGDKEATRITLVEATLDALQGLIPFNVRAEAAEIVSVGSRSLAVVSLERDFDPLVGSATVRIGEDDALARATLDAVNRFLPDPALV